MGFVVIQLTLEGLKLLLTDNCKLESLVISSYYKNFFISFIDE